MMKTSPAVQKAGEPGAAVKVASVVNSPAVHVSADPARLPAQLVSCTAITVCACTGAAPRKHATRHAPARSVDRWFTRSEEHTSELQSLMRISYAVFCLKKKITDKKIMQ